MNHDKEAMGEQPIFTCQAHVFHIDPKTKRTWITASTKAVSVSFFYDSSRHLYRIISVEGAKAVINSTITPSMSFTQTSQKFGQWSDVRANTVYGLGFSSEAELTKFVEKFQEVKEATKNALAKSTTNGSSAATPVTSANTSPVTGRTSVFQNDNNNDIKVDPPQMMTSNIQNSNLESPSHKVTSTVTTNNLDIKPVLPILNNSIVEIPIVGTLTHNEQQLKYQNERLKAALAQSGANAKNWEIELATLKSNNIRLTSALQESTANVDEWKRQLHTYKEDNIRLKRELDMVKVSSGSAASAEGNDINEELRREIIILKTRIQSLEKDLMNQEIELKAANNSLKDRSNDQSIKQINEISDKFAEHLFALCNAHKDMDKVLHLHKST